MDKLQVSTFVERVWYQRLQGSKETIRKTLWEWIIRDAVNQGVDLDLSTFAIEEYQEKKRGCEDNLRITATCSILKEEE